MTAHGALIAGLLALGVPEHVAHELLWLALDEDPIAGVERALLCVLRRLPETEVAATLREARDTIDALSARVELLESALRELHGEQERAAVARLDRRHPLLPSV